MPFTTIGPSKASRAHLRSFQVKDWLRREAMNCASAWVDAPVSAYLAMELKLGVGWRR